jgi:hypothetical protein
MTVKARDLGEPPPPRAPRPLAAQIIAGIILLLLFVLAVRAIPAAFVSPQTADQPMAAPVSTALAPLELAITPATEPTATPATVPLAELAARLNPTPAVLPAGCPSAITLPEGARVGWLGRMASCPSVLYASVGGVRQWVRRPADFPETLYEQLPNLQP